MALTCYDVANYFLSKIDEEAGDAISNLKLQKLVYYAQGFSLALLHRPLFNDTIVAWQHGPVVVDLYRKYKGYGSNGIPAPKDVDFDKFSADEKNLLDNVYDVYGQFSAWKLRNMTHEEAPWKTTPINGVISHDALLNFFNTRIDAAD